jgi:radical SAM protein with 4Fe4S-binding SPASM domain
VNKRPVSFHAAKPVQDLTITPLEVSPNSRRAEYRRIPVQDITARDDYLASRDYSKKSVRALCYAPYNSLYFDTQGSVRVCCHNHQFPVGNILQNSVDEIWRGERISVLREALADGEFGPGCQFCEFQTAEGCFKDAAMHRFDAFPVLSNQPEWPQQLEFSISNACNLECVMCSGKHSSAIRAKREKLPPQSRLYSRAFLESMVDYLANASWLKFLGGEPFLVQEYYQIWDLMIANGITTRCHVTTNGTQFNGKVQNVLDRIPMSFSVSMDGVRRETIESIRVNAEYDVLMSNARRFRDYAKAKGTSFGLTYCLMRQNWREFGEFCVMADEWGCNVAVNTVRNPPEFGIYTMSSVELGMVLKAMEAEAVQLENRLTRNRKVWFGELDRIRAKVRVAEPMAQQA